MNMVDVLNEDPSACVAGATAAVPLRSVEDVERVLLCSSPSFAVNNECYAGWACTLLLCSQGAKGGGRGREGTPRLQAACTSSSHHNRGRRAMCPCGSPAARIALFCDLFTTF